MGPRSSVQDLIRPLLLLLPEVQKPDKRVPLLDKVIYTSCSLLIFLVCSQLPLYGIHWTTGSDPFRWVRAILVSRRGTVMEIGISPIVTSGMVMQLLLGSNIIHVDKTLPEDRELMNKTQKLLAIFIAFGQATAYLLSGFYGTVAQLGTVIAMLIVLQLVFGTIIVICLDELLQKGYGLGSAVSLFIATNTCENIIWKSFSPTTIKSSRGVEFEGAVVALFHKMITRADKVKAVHEAFYRKNLPNVTNLISTILIFLVVVYLRGFHVALPLRSRNARGQQGSLPFKLFYTSNMPTILLFSLVSNLSFISQRLYMKYGGNFFVNLLGKWKESEYSGLSTPVAGIAYYITAPSSLADMAADPFHAIIYVVFVLTGCAAYTRAWMDVSGSSRRYVARRLREQQLMIPGHRESNLRRELNSYIFLAAAFSGICVGILTILADIMGVVVSETRILLAVTIICQYLETFEKERASNQLVDFLGFQSH